MMEGGCNEPDSGNTPTLERVEDKEVDTENLQPQCHKQKVLGSGHEDLGMKNKAYVSNWRNSHSVERFSKEFIQEQIVSKPSRRQSGGFSDQPKNGVSINGAFDGKEVVKNLKNHISQSSDGGPRKGLGRADCQKHKAGLVHVDVEQLIMRLQVLEEENQSMKKAFFQSAKERSDLMDEVSLQYQTIYQQFIGRVAGTKPCLPLKASKGGNRTNGLSEVLQSKWNPSLVSRATQVTTFSPHDVHAVPYK